MAYIKKNRQIFVFLINGKIFKLNCYTYFLSDGSFIRHNSRFINKMEYTRRGYKCTGVCLQSII